MKQIDDTIPKSPRTPLPIGAKLIVIILCAAIFSFIGWASAAKLNELARAQGQVIAKQRTQVVQSIDGGILRTLNVSEGDTVRKGQLLATFDNTRAEAAFNDSQNKVAALQARLARLHAEIYDLTEVTFPDSLLPWPQFIENQKNLFEKRRRALDESITAQSHLRNLAHQELMMTKPLLDLGDVGRAQVIRLEKQVAELDGKIINQKNQYFQEAQTEMAKADEELAAQLELMRERRLILDNTEIFSPADGVVINIGITTLGATMKSGEAIIEILPTDSKLVFEAKFAPADMAPLKPGLEAQIKLDAYDYSIYGSVHGRVSYISPDSLTDKDTSKGKFQYYRVQIEIQPHNNTWHADSNENQKNIRVMPGMTGLVEVRTRDKTLLSYLTKPITKTLDAALIER
jgi:multidrug efflux pump subunit AcrA (membrane-fusion protein)